MSRTTFIAGLLILACSCAAALEISYSNVNPGGGVVTNGEGLLLKGEIVPGDYERLLDVLRRDQGRFWRTAGFILASPGGDIQEALQIARLVKGSYSTVWVGKAGPCVSACFFIYSAAVRREGGANSLGIHRPYIHPQRLQSVSVPEAESLQKQAFRQARLYLESQDVPTNLIDKMFQQASTDVYWLSREEIEQQLGRRPPWYEQLLIAKCGLDTSIERKYWLTGDATLIPQLVSTEACGNRLSLEEGRKFLKAELGSPATR